MSKKKSETFTLIDGVFSLEDAREILMNLIHRKIQYHNIQNLSSLERRGGHDPVSQNRIKELEKTRRQILEMLEANSSDSDREVQVNSEINITFNE
ncbi:MAG: hypothetical protein GVY08_13185 [Bacteroidetes bacterium]|jgi:hypothetical protein|nr:hypothetical protein [Bacteroidota bacterium]